MNLPYDNPAILPVSERESMHEGFLQRHFDVAFAAPDGIKKLRELILTLAMQGKLVPQDPNDPPASELLKATEAEKQRLVEEGKIKIPKPLAAIKPEEVPYQLPQGWEWVRLGNVSVRIHYGYTASANNELKKIRLLRITDIQDNEVDWESVPGCDIKEKDVAQYLLANNDILIAGTGGTVGKSYLVRNIEVDAVFASYLIRVIPSDCIDVDYLKFFVESPLYWKQLYAACSGTGQPNVNGTSLSTLLIALPPLVEQHRIVAKIDQLMARCDELEKLRAGREQKRRAVNHAALKRLLDAASSFPRRRESSASDHSPGCADLDPSLCGSDGRGDASKEAFADAWQFIARHFNELYSVKENVTELRKAILQLAVMGKLVPQDPSDPPASTLLKAIEIEKQRLVKESRLKKGTDELVLAHEEYIGRPAGWEYCRLGNLARFIDYRGKTPNKVKSGIPLITAKNVRFGFINREPYEYVTEAEYESWMTRGFPKIGDLLFTTEAPLGNIAIIDIQERFALAQRVICFQLYKSDIANFLKYLIMSTPFQNQLLENATGMTATGIKSARLKEIPIPLPPLPEQHRIVAKVDQLMALCGTLENKIDAASNQQTALLNALMAQG